MLSRLFLVAVLAGGLVHITTQSQSGAPQSAASITGVVNVRDFGAAGDCVADDTAAIQSAVDALRAGGTLYLPGTPGGRCYRVTSGIVLPKLNGITVMGDGMRATRIQVTARGSDGFDLTAPGPTNNYTFRDLGIETDHVGRCAIDARNVYRSAVVDCRLTGFETAGIRFTTSFAWTLRGVQFEQNGNGILETAGGASMTNMSLFACRFENRREFGVNVYQALGWTVSGCLFESNAKGGLKITTAGGGLSISGNYFEENRDGSASGASDISLGESSYVKGVVIEGNYFNGRSAADESVASNYVPVSLGYTDRVEIVANYLNTGSVFLAFVPGTTSSYVRVQRTAFGPGVRAASRVIYGSFDARDLKSRGIEILP